MGLQQIVFLEIVFLSPRVYLLNYIVKSWTKLSIASIFTVPVKGRRPS
jgi:hypothetical protein